MSTLLGKKLGMTHIFQEDGLVTPVTAIEAGPCVVTQIKTTDRDGYQAIQVGFGHAKKMNSPLKGHVKGLGDFRYFKEFRVDNVEDYSLGQSIDASIFGPGDYVDVIGVSKGKGFAGVVKRHHFAGGPKTHGQSDRHRAPGSIGSGTTPGRVYKGIKMAGHMGVDRVTVQNLKVVRSEVDKNLLLIKGAVPGPKNGFIIIRKAKKKG